MRNSRILSNTEFQNTDYLGFHPIYVRGENNTDNMDRILYEKKI